MTKINVSNLQPGPQMDALVAMARGWIKGPVNLWFREGDLYQIAQSSVSDYNPSTNGGQAMELVKEFPMVFGCDDETKPTTYRAQCLYGHCIEPKDSPTPEIAICRAVIAAHFGDEVEINS